MARAVALVLVAIGRAAAAENGTEGPARVVVTIPERRLAVLDTNGDVVRTFDVAVGAALSPSPTGTFTVVNRLENPTYYHPGKVVGPGKTNPLGPRWLGLSLKGFGIHGTNAPRSIGRAASHGCIRLRNADIVALFELVRVGDMVEIRGEREERVAEVAAAE